MDAMMMKAMEEIKKVADKGVEEAVLRLSQMYGFDFAEAMQRLAEPVAVVEPVVEQEQVEEQEVSSYEPSALWSREEDDEESSDEEEYSDAIDSSADDESDIDGSASSSASSPSASASSSASASADKKRKTREAAKGCRVLSKCLTDGQRVRTAVSASTCKAQLEGSYNATTKKIAYGGKFYSLNQFAELQIETNIPTRCKAVNAWSNCMCEIDGKFVKMTNLPVLSA
jgi:hypothetical protein